MSKKKNKGIVRKIIAGILGVTLLGTAFVGIGCAVNENFREKVKDIFHIETKKDLKTQINDLKQRFEALKNADEQIKKLQNERANLIAEKSEMQVKLTENASKITALQNEKSKLEEQISNMTSEEEVANLRSQITELNEQIQNLQADNTRLNSKITELEAQVTALENQVAELQNDIVNLNTELDNLTEQMLKIWNIAENYNKYTSGGENLEESPTLTESEKEIVLERINQLTEDVNQKTEQKSEASNRKIEAETEIENLNSQKQNIQNSVNEKNSTIESNSTRIEELQSKQDLGTITEDETSELSDLQNQNTSLANEISQLQEEINAINEEIEILENNNKELNNQIATIQASIDKLQNQINSFNDFVNSSTIVPDNPGTGEEQHTHIESDPVIENENFDEDGIVLEYDNVTYCSTCGEEITREHIVVETEEPVEENEIQGTWVFNEELVMSKARWFSDYFDVDFTSNNKSYSSLEIEFAGNSKFGYNLLGLKYGDDSVYNKTNLVDSFDDDYIDTLNETSNWLDQSYRTITINSTLNDLENGEQLLAWLNANAVKQNETAEEPVEQADELQGFWTLNDTLNMDSYNQAATRYYVNFKSNETEYSSIAMQGPNRAMSDNDIVPAANFILETNLLYGYDIVYNILSVSLVDEGWINEDYKTIEITSKLSEVENGAELLAWLQINAVKHSDHNGGTN